MSDEHRYLAGQLWRIHRELDRAASPLCWARPQAGPSFEDRGSVTPRPINLPRATARYRKRRA